MKLLIFQEKLTHISWKNYDYVVLSGKGQKYENQNVENQKEHRKPCKPSQRREDLLKRSERRKGKRSEHQKEYQN
jgi:hypothetical protein